MDFQELLTIVADQPLFETGLLLAGERDPAALRVQLVRWVKSGRLLQLRRGLYALAEPYRHVDPHPFVVANRLAPGSYVSLESALAHSSMIPEGIAQVQSVGLGRTRQWATPLGGYSLRHVHRGLFYGYQRLQVAPDQWAYCAEPAKALLDLVYLTPGGDDPAYLASLRLQNWQAIDLDRLQEHAERSSRLKLRTAAATLVKMAQERSEEAAA